MMRPVLGGHTNACRSPHARVPAALIALIVDVVGAGIGPLVVGASSGLLAPSLGATALRYAILVSVLAALLGAVFCLTRHDSCRRNSERAVD